MAKMFYTIDETAAALGKNEEEVKQLTREGRLREYRDGAKLMYKADQVDQLKAELTGEAAADAGLSGVESGAPIDLMDSRGGSGSVIGLMDSTNKGDTALPADLGGSASGIPASGGSRTGTATGITVFGMEGEKADPSAQTVVSQGDQINLDAAGSGSGSGLLDLTRESDDTSLGADLLTEIQQPSKGSRAGKSPVVGAGPTGTEATLAGVESAVVRPAPTPVTTEAHDSLAPALGAASLCTALVLIFAAVALISAFLGYQPAYLEGFIGSNGIPVTFGYLLIPVVIFFFIGLFVGKTARR